MHLLMAALIVLANAAPLPAREAAWLAGARAVALTAVPPDPSLLRRPEIPWVPYFTTGYDDYGTTASGTAARYGEVAVDPNVIPLGAYLEIQGYPGVIFHAEDTGGLILGRRIDIFFPDLADCYKATGWRLARWSLHRSDLE